LKIDFNVAVYTNETHTKNNNSNTLLQPCNRPPLQALAVPLWQQLSTTPIASDQTSDHHGLEDGLDAGLDPGVIENEAT
jgi:hypothetical protein